MASIIRDLIEYDGINNFPPENIKNFKQLNYENSFCIPKSNPDIEQIIKVSANIDIYKYEVIKTPIGISLEGKELTGNKLILFGDIHYKIKYMSNEDTQSVHIFNKYIPFCADIVLSRNFNSLSYINPYAFIEDIFLDKFDGRFLYSNITFLLIADTVC